MKRKIFFCFIILCSVIVCFAQERTTMWPYKYSEFTDGTVYLKDGKTLSVPLNIHLLKSALHYLDKDRIKEATSADIEFVQIGFDKYRMVNKQLMFPLVGDSTGYVAELLLADLEALQESGGAYGSASNTQATRQLSSMEIGGVSRVNHIELKEKKDEGELLPLKIQYFIVTTDEVYPANQKEIRSRLPEEKQAAFKQFVKQHKIKWKQPASLFELLEFLKDL
ncbi:MAG: hypothetical protein LBS25_09860 [Candidatus Symbiothrix sp.]|jgi:hypothetical protein|nr:hypothetical protein [Candidatus Symbiothrix sp.]